MVFGFPRTTIRRLGWDGLMGETLICLATQPAAGYFLTPFSHIGLAIHYDIASLGGFAKRRGSRGEAE